jgi:hypothetical protein
MAFNGFGVFGKSSMILTHYHHKADRPFQNLAALSDAAALAVIADLQSRSGAVYRRFRDPVPYLAQRRSTERWLREAFIQQGGRPQSAYPHYFVVGRSSWIEAGFEGEYGMVQLPIAAFPVETVSFTYTDSMISHWLRSQTEQAFYHPEYHGRVFGLSGIHQVIATFGLPGEAWRSTTGDDQSLAVASRYNLFIEAQVWIKTTPTMMPEAR